MSKGSPSNVSRKLLEELLNRMDILPFSEIILFSKKKHIEYIKENFQNLRVISYTELSKISEDYLVHFPMLPLIFPNSKFLLYLHTRFIRRKKIIIQYHGDIRTELKSNFKDPVSLIHLLSYIFVPNLLKNADRVITHSYYMKGILENYGVLKSVVIPNAVDNYWFQPCSNSICVNELLDKSKLNIFYHGRLSWEKGVDLLLKAAGDYVKSNPNTRIYLAGDGPQKNHLKELCSKLDIERKVIFMGHLNKEEIKFFLKNVDLAIYPSRFDNFPLAVLEALSCANCPIYFSKNIGIYDFAIRDGFELNFFELNSQNIIKIFESIKKEKMSVSYQVNFANRYSWDLIVPKYVETYNSVL
ncbi:glycosyltransferase family 4 protein [Methanosarcina mazei]|uniref:Glycosyl transferase family 1 domain-containing protein n=2 Tax=Methanosarcina mazei TaxID=2209 RepID=A0A0F8NIK1_METMZ|nr:glycosyltransferase family 4 protein [Methanosarcina mazei]KKH17586.1 hypothetical protein DU44_06260 [Methanosarcina mazei]KKH17773.1 hypothetical protein DU48_06230 [Methanosarcina mazei]KKH24983.1 hypothetical protein DU65_05920 [Methanosarcina mazei]